MNQLVSCAGSTSGSNKIITATSLFTSSNSNAFGIQISGLISPPTTGPKDVFTITSMQNGYPIDVCTTTVSGLVANTITVTVTTGTAAAITVNKLATLKFTFTLADFINNNDTFMIVFPSGSKLTTPTIGGGQIFASGTSLNSLTVTFGQTSTIRTFSPASSPFFTMTNYTAPPSTQVTSAI